MNNSVKPNGENILKTKTSFINSTPKGMHIVVHGEKYFLKYINFPWFEYCNILELKNITADRWGVYWNDLDIDLSIDSIKYPDQYSNAISVERWLKIRNKKAASILGQVCSLSKAKSSRINGIKGGRPRKKTEHVFA